MLNESRTYENVYPHSGVVTIVLTKEIKEIGAYVSLLEYSEVQAMLLVSELSRRRFRSVKKLIKVGKKEIVTVIRVNKGKGYFDVSKRQIVEGEATCMEKKLIYSKLINTIGGQISKKLFLNGEDIKIRWVWPMYRKFKHAICGFKRFSKNKTGITGLNLYKIENQIFSEILKKKIPVNFQKIEVFFELICFSEKGISDLKNSLENQIKSIFFNRIEISMIVPPLFSITLKTKSKRKGIKTIYKILQNVSEKIKTKKGNLSVKKIRIH